MQIVALDLSLTGTGIVVDGVPRTIETKLRDEPRLAHLEDTILAECAGADFVILEGLAYAAKVGKSAERDALHFMIRTRLWRQDTPFLVIPPTVLKKYITGRGNASKDEVLISTTRTFLNVDFKDNNQCDAYVLYAMAHHRYGKAFIDLPKINLTALDTVEWPEGI